MTAALAAALLSCAVAGALGAQAVALPAPAPGECYRFAFGAWSPPLEPQRMGASGARAAAAAASPALPASRRTGAARSAGTRDSASSGGPPGTSSDSGAAVPAAAPAPDWAARVPTKVGVNTAADSALVLFPAWWPVGVGITWTDAHADTLIGTAQAFVSDGRLPVPTAAARAIRIACRG